MPRIFPQICQLISSAYGCGMQLLSLHTRAAASLALALASHLLLVFRPSPFDRFVSALQFIQLAFVLSAVDWACSCGAQVKVLLQYRSPRRRQHPHDARPASSRRTNRNHSQLRSGEATQQRGKRIYRRNQLPLLEPVVDVAVNGREPPRIIHARDNPQAKDGIQ